MSVRDFEWDYGVSLTLTAETELTNPQPIGLHVTDTSGTVNCEWYRRNELDATVQSAIYITQGDFVKCRPFKVLSDSTAVGVVALYRAKHNR